MLLASTRGSGTACQAVLESNAKRGWVRGLEAHCRQQRRQRCLRLNRDMDV